MSSAANAWQIVPPAPGRPAQANGSESTPTKTAVGAQPASPPAGQDPGLMGWFPFLILIPFVLILFLNSRSQQKKAQKLLAELKKGDRVLIQGGVVGKLVEMGDRYAKVEIAPGVKIEVIKSGLLGKDSPETAANVEKK